MKKERIKTVLCALGLMIALFPQSVVNGEEIHKVTMEYQQCGDTQVLMESIKGA